MSDSPCIFCKIAQKAIPSDLVYEDEHMVVFHDIHPKAPVHLLLVPKQHIKSLMALTDKHTALMSHLIFQLPLLAKQHGLHEGFRTAIHTGPKGGQEIDHLHIHLMGG